MASVDHFHRHNLELCRWGGIERCNRSTQSLLIRAWSHGFHTSIFPTFLAADNMARREPTLPGLAWPVVAQRAFTYAESGHTSLRNSEQRQWRSPVAISASSRVEVEGRGVYTLVPHQTDLVDSYTLGWY